MAASFLFLMKKAVSAAIYPLGVSLVLWIGGLILLRRKRNGRTGVLVILAGGVLLLVMSSPLTAYLLIRPLEISAGPYADAQTLCNKGVRFIVALGGGSGKNDLSAADRTGGGLFRVMEGVRLWRDMPDANLLLSGMGFPPGRTDPESMAALPTELGVPRNALILEARAWDTEDEARFFAEVVGQRPFALVTSAYHIPRAMRQFRNQGLNPVAAPCEFLADRPPPVYEWFLLDAGALQKTQLAIHEYLGLIWLEMKQAVKAEPRSDSQ